MDARALSCRTAAEAIALAQDCLRRAVELQVQDGARLSAAEWAEICETDRTTTQRWRTAAGLRGDLSRAQWDAITPKRFRRGT